jgi:4-hydroxybenzoate polyprenyltransferase
MNHVFVNGRRIKFKAYLQLVRAPGLFSIITNIIASTGVYLYLVPSVEVSLMTLSFLLAISCMCYQSGMILNDVADFYEDSQERPFRPLPSGLLSRKFAILSSILLLIIALSLTVFINVSLTIAVGALIILILSYNFLTKKSSFGPINMGLIRMANFLLVMAAMQHFDQRMLWVASLVFIYTVIVTVISRFETISFSNRVKPILFLLVMLMVGLGLKLMFQLHSSLANSALFVFIGFLAWKLFHFMPKSSEDTQRLVTLLLKSMVLLDSAVLIFFDCFLLGTLCAILFILSSKLAKYVYMT